MNNSFSETCFFILRFYYLNSFTKGCGTQILEDLVSTGYRWINNDREIFCLFESSSLAIKYNLFFEFRQTTLELLSYLQIETVVDHIIVLHRVKTVMRWWIFNARWKVDASRKISKRIDSWINTVFSLCHLSFQAHPVTPKRNHFPYFYRMWRRQLLFWKLDSSFIKSINYLDPSFCPVDLLG